MPSKIAVMGGGGFSMEPENPLLDDWLIELTQTSKPKICFLPTASADSEEYTSRFYAAFEGKATCSHLPLFQRTESDLAPFLLAQDLLYVGGGNTANMLAIWRVHGVDQILRQAWEQGVVLAGLSAGSLCWFEGGITDSFGPTLAPLLDGLGFLLGSHCPHYDGEAQRRPTYESCIQDQSLPPGIAVEDSVAVLYEGGRRVDIVASKPDKAAYEISLDETKQVVSHRLAARFLGS